MREQLDLGVRYDPIRSHLEITVLGNSEVLETLLLFSVPRFLFHVVFVSLGEGSQVLSDWRDTEPQVLEYQQTVAVVAEDLRHEETDDEG